MLGTLDDDQALSLVQAMVEANGERVMALINEAAARGIEWKRCWWKCRPVASYCDGTTFACCTWQRHGRHRAADA